MRATVAFALSPSFELGDSADVELTLRYLFVEDGRSGESCSLAIEAPDGFSLCEGTDMHFLGALTREAVEFRGLVRFL